MSDETLPDRAEQETFPVLIKQGGLPPKVHHISKKDRDIVDAFISCGSMRIVSKEQKMNIKDVSEILARPEFKTYIAERFKRAADKNDITEEKIMSKLNLVLESDGAKKFDPSFLKAIETAAKIMKLIQPNSLQIGVQVNNNPYKELPDEDLDKIIEERLHGTKKPNEA